jgi:hypothetical protein
VKTSQDTVVPDRLRAGKDSDAMNPDPMGADFELVTESMAHLAKCNVRHVGQHFELERADVIAIFFSENFIA